MNSSVARELNLDGLVGPTHNYAGLSFGNIASARHGLTVSRPRQAALEGLAKMKFVASLGVPQAVLPPQPRPDLKTLRRLGFTGTDADVIEKAHRDAPRLLAAVYSSSAMWTANAATVSPGADTADARVHFTPANLVSQFHRSLEPQVTARILRQIFPESSGFVHHEPLPSAPFVGDEGAANHMRLASSHGSTGVELFVYGAAQPGESAPAKFPARQTLEACRAVARLHRLKESRTLFLRQSPLAVDAGAFHNDVVAVANENVLFFHSSAYADAADVTRQLRNTCDFDLHLIEVPESRIPLAEAVETYLFNSQLLSSGEGKMVLIAPVECQERQNVRTFIDELIASENPITAVQYLDVRQSMKNGGGPACLRLRAVLTDEQLANVHPGVIFTDTLYARLVDWVQTHYRDELHPQDLRDPNLLRESEDALANLEAILGITLATDK